jgi:hypothetical protein
MAAETVVFTSRRTARVQRVQAARHVLVGLLLASSGYNAIREGHHASWLDVVAIVSGLLLLAAFVVEMRLARRGGARAHHGIGWVDVFAAIVTAVEAAHLRHNGKVGLPIAYGLVAVLLLMLGLMHGRLQHLRRLVVDEHGFDIRMAPWSRTRLAWSDVADVHEAGSVVTVVTLAAQERRLDLREADHGDVVVETLLRHARAALALPEPASALAPDVPDVRPDDAIDSSS